MAAKQKQSQEQVSKSTVEVEKLHNDAIEKTKQNKDMAEKTNLKIKYPEETAYVQGEADRSMILKVNNVNDQILKKGQKAQFLGHLKNSSYQISYEKSGSKPRLDNSIVIYNTAQQDSALNAAKKIA